MHHRIIATSTKAFSVAIALSAMAIAQPATAASFVATYTGTINDGADDTGVFGSIGSLVGQSVAIAFIFDDAIPGAVDDSSYPNIRGLTGYGTASPGNAVVTIGGISAAIAGSYYSQAVQRDGEGGNYDEIEHGVYTFSDTTGSAAEASIGSYANDFLSNLNLFGPFSYTAQAGDSASGFFQFDQGSAYAYGNIDFTSVDIKSIGAVPEPATWGLMILGFGLIGAAVRRRQNIRTTVSFACARRPGGG